MNISKKIFTIILSLIICLVMLFMLCRDVFAAQTYSYSINSIDDVKYPGYKEAIKALQEKHPNWDFQVMHTGLDWEEVINNENFHTNTKRTPSNLVEAGDTKHDGAWICPVCGTATRYDSGSWLCASEAAIAYMMDPRNFLNETDIFQFEKLNYNASQTIAGVTSSSNATFLARESGIAETILNNAKINDMNAYFIAARLKQEQGKGGNTVSGTYPGYEGYYNAFNISASGNSKTTVITNALGYAKSQGWTSICKSITGGMTFLKNQYINQGQDTLYLQKFDVESAHKGLYSYQYMQNLIAAQSEASTMRSVYSKTNTIESQHTFLIPLYENMPASACQRPASTSGNTTSTGFGVKYSSHVQDLGWENNWIADGSQSGTTGQNKKVEAMKIELVNAPSGASIKYASYVEGAGWQNEVANGAVSGTTGQNRKVYAIKMSLQNANGYEIKYKVHVQDVGWTDWYSGGAVAGANVSKGLKIEAIKIKIVKSSSNNGTSPDIEYISHVQDLGWETMWRASGATSGTTGQNKKIEAIELKLLNMPSGVNVKYASYVEEIGWQNEVANGAISGTTGQNRKVYAIKIDLENTNDYSIKYRAHVQDVGWTDWVADGAVAGVDVNRALKIEAIQVKIVKENVNRVTPVENTQEEPTTPNVDTNTNATNTTDANTTTENITTETSNIGVEYISHVQDIGWEKTWIKNGAQSGTTGKNKKVEAMQIKLVNAPTGVNVKYRAYVDGIGWQEAVENGATSGTTGQNRKMYAIRIALENTDKYSISYRVHVQDIGWLNWVQDGTTTGEITKQKKIEAIEVKIEDKKQSKIGVEYISHVQDYGWENNWIADGAQSGTTGQNKKVEAVRIELKNAPAGVGISYSLNAEGQGWVDAKDGQIGGTVGKNKKVYGIKINLENTTKYSVQYRVHVQDVGWLNWVKDGELGGLTSQDKKIEAIEIKIVEK